MAKYIYQYENWTDFKWQDDNINSLFGEVRNLQGKIKGQMSVLGFSIKEETTLRMLAMDVVKSSEIEGEILDYQQVRSSIAKRLGINLAGIVHVDRHVEGVVEMMLDATQSYLEPLTHERLYGWHSALFPAGFSGMYKIETGQYRSGEMQIVSGPLGKQTIHYEAVPANQLKFEMDKFLFWLNNDLKTDKVLKAAIAHFWFIIIHPFDDGNGRIARAISDMLLTQSDGGPERFYSMSSQIMIERKKYYEVLQKVQHYHHDITEWMQWFLNCLKNALINTDITLNKILFKNDFWLSHEHTEFNKRQRLMLNKLLDGFEGKLQSSKWAKICKCSADTALRDIKELMEKGILKHENNSGRSTSYVLVFDKE
jgi:Fic family protein